MSPDILLLIGFDLVVAPIVGIGATFWLRRLYRSDPEQSWILRIFYYSSVAINIAVLPLVAVFMYALYRRVVPEAPMFQYGLLIFAISLFILEMMAAWWVLVFRRKQQSNLNHARRKGDQPSEGVGVEVDQVSVGPTVAVDDRDVDAHLFRANSDGGSS